MRKVICLLVITLVIMAMPICGFAAGLPPEQEVKQTVEAYFDLRYSMLSTLVFDDQLNGWLAPDILASQDVMNEADILETIIKYRQSQVNDLRFDRFQYNINYVNVKLHDNKAWVVLDENYELYFKCAPTVRNQIVVPHILMLEKIQDKWVIVKDDYADGDGIKKILNDYFVGNNISKATAKQLVLDRFAENETARISKLQELLAEEGNSGLTVFFAGKNIAYASGQAKRIDPISNAAVVRTDGVMMLPVRFTCENLGGTVSWEGDTNTVQLQLPDHEISYHQGDQHVLMDGDVVMLEATPPIIKGTTMLPAQVLAAAAGKTLTATETGLAILSNGEYDLEKNAALVNRLTEYFNAFFTKSNFPRIDGSTATYPLSIEIGKELLGLDDTGSKGFITHNTTHNAYVNLINGNADIIFVTQPSPEEYQLAKDKGVELEVIPICKEGFVFLVNRENPVNNLSAKQVQDIYRGHLKNWQAVGGEDLKIVAYQREANSGSQTIMENTVMKGLQLANPPKEVLVYGMGELIDRVADFSNARNSLGYSVYYYATHMYQNRNVKILAINGVQPDVQTFKDETYPFSVSYYAVLRKDVPADSSARRLLEWVLGEEGQKVVARAGLAPVQ
jgi:phosphate transport system substrate-binding protein